MDVRTPPIKSIADFLLYLFQDRKLQPSTIEGYRSAIADKLGNSPNNGINISKDGNLTHLLDSFHRDRSRGRRGIPSWNLSLVLYQLTKAVFLLAFGSVKCRSEIHAWLNKNIRHQSDWSQDIPHPASSPKTIWSKRVQTLWLQWLYQPWLKLWTSHSRLSLCQVRSLGYYVFVSFKKGFGKDISPATISSWIKQTVILCYELSDQEALVRPSSQESS